MNSSHFGTWSFRHLIKSNLMFQMFKFSNAIALAQIYCFQFNIHVHVHLLILVEKMTINTQCSREAGNISFIVFGLTRPGLKPIIYHIRGEFLYYLIHVHEYA
jgi:hypothetical protein